VKLEPTFGVCPKCQTTSDVIPKVILIGKASPTALNPNHVELAGYQRHDQLAVDECKPETLQEGALQQFIDGYFCTKCGVGFVSEEVTVTKKTKRK